MAIRRNFTNSLCEKYGKDEADALFFYTVETLTGLDKAQILAKDDYGLTDKTKPELENVRVKLLQNVPIQHIFGETEFCGLTFKVNKNVLIPRPETAELVNFAAEGRGAHLDGKDKDEDFRVLDIGTGSGCIAISIAKRLPNATVRAIDVSPAALKTAQENAKLNGVDVEFMQGDALKLDDMKCGKEMYDVIVSNPPYIKESERKNMSANVLDFEPSLALFVPDNNALVFYRAIARYAVEHLYRGGKLLFEINENLGRDTESLVNSFNFTSVRLEKDFCGKDRYIIAEK
jgi:release factor glutamine methyltransferase